MGRNRLDELDASERRNLQQVICHLLKNRRPDLNHSEYENLLDIANSAKDGAVFRKIARGKQLVSRLKLEKMIHICEKASILTEQEVREEMQIFFDRYDDEIIRAKFVEFCEQLDVMSTLILMSNIEIQDEFIKEMIKTIKKVKGTKQ